MKPQKQTDPMDEAYKLLDGAPAIDGVSRAAKGQVPKTDNESYHDETEARLDRLNDRDGVEEDTPDTTNIDKAYVMLFKSLAAILSSRR